MPSEERRVPSQGSEDLSLGEPRTSEKRGFSSRGRSVAHVRSSFASRGIAMTRDRSSSPSRGIAVPSDGGAFTRDEFGPSAKDLCSTGEGMINGASRSPTRRRG